MQIERTQIYRVKTVAEAFDVSVATIYRAVESGALRAQRLGTGRGAVRIPGDALLDYISDCERAAPRASLSDQPATAASFGGAA
jgi:excisionase family DNA binding protein